MSIIYAPQSTSITDTLLKLREAAERSKSQGLQDQAAQIAIAEKQAQQQQAQAALMALVGGGAQVTPVAGATSPTVNGGVRGQAPSVSAPQAPQLQYTPDPMSKLAPEVRAQVQASQVQAAGPAPRKGNADTRLAQAPTALAAVRADRSRQTALGALTEHEQSILRATDGLVDDGTRERALADIKLAKAQIEANGDPAQVATLLTSMGSTAGQLIDRAIKVEEIKNARNEVTRLKAATEGLRKLGVEVPEGVEYVEGADAYFLSLDQMARGHRNDLARIAAQEQSELRVEARRTQNRREEIAAQTEGEITANYVAGIQTNMQLLMKDPRFAQNPEGLMSEATSRAIAQIRSANPTLAQRFEQSHVVQTARQYVGGTQLMKNYVQEILTLSATENVENVRRDVRWSGGRLGSLNAGEFLPAKIPPARVAELESQWLQFAANQGVDEGTARQIWRIEGARELIDGYNAGIDEMHRAGIPASQWGQVLKANIADQFVRMRATLTGQDYPVREPMTRANQRKRFFEERFRGIPGVELNRNTAGQPVRQPSILSPREQSNAAVVSQMPRR